MQQEPNPADAETMHEQGVLERLLGQSSRYPWTVDEMVRSQQDSQTTRLDTIDAIKRLQSEGLIHRTSGDVIFPTRAALYLDRIVG
jgi:hypothetical protein